MMNAMVKREFGMMGGVSPAGGPLPIPLMDNRPPLLTPMAMQQQQQQQQIALPQPPGGSISLALLIDFIVQRTHHELTILAELLPRKTDMERKQEIFNFSAKTRLLAVRLLGLVKWASSAAKVDKSVHIMAFLEKQSMLFIETADVLSRMARETLVQARLPNFHIPAAVEVLTTGTYSRLPTCIRERIVPPDPITALERKSTLTKLNQVIQHRLVMTDLPVQMRNLKIEQGRVVFRVENEFQVSLTVLGDSPTTPWRIIDIDILVEDKEIGDGMSLVHQLQIGFIHQLGQSRLDNSNAPLRELYDYLHFFAQSLQLEVLYSQVLKLCRERLGDYLIIEEYSVGQSLILGYWKELTTRDPRAELGYRVIVSVDTVDRAQPLSVTHQPPLPIDDISQPAESLTTNQFEKILVHTVYLRSKVRLAELSKEIELQLSVKCTLEGSPPVLSIPILAYCIRSEQLQVTVNIHTGGFVAHVPQVDNTPAVVTEIQNVLNSTSQDLNKLKGLISQLRYWVTERRCEKTLQHLPASAGDRISLLKWEENPVLSKIGPHRITIKFQKHPYAILIVEFKEKEEAQNEMEYFFYLIIVKKASAEESDELPAGASTGGSIPKFFLKPMTVIPLDTFSCTHGSYTEADDVEPSAKFFGKRKFDGISGVGNAIEVNVKRQKHPPYFVPEIAHIVAMCDERLPFALLTSELTNRNIVHTGIQVEADGANLSVNILRFPTVLAGIPEQTLTRLLHKLSSATMRAQIQLKGFRTWNLELKFDSALSRKIPGADKPLNFIFEMSVTSEDSIPKLVDLCLNEWTAIAKLFQLLERSRWITRLEMPGLAAIKNFNWNRLSISYGPNRSATANIMYSCTDKCFKLSLGGLNLHNPHTLMRSQLQGFLNFQKKDALENLIKLLNDTYEPLSSLSKLPTTPQLGVIHSRPQFPIQTFVLLPQSPCHVRIVYNTVYCLDVHFQPEGLVSIRDGAYSLFDKTQVLGELTPTQWLKAFLSKYVDENAVYRRRSQSEDDNPPSPISTLMDVDHNVGTPTGGPGSSSSFLSIKPQSPAPGRSNPHTPASPHIPPGPTGFSPATSFANLASPPSLPNLASSQPSPNPSSSILHHPSPSPSTLLPAPSPSGGPLSVPVPSPNPAPGGSMQSSTGGPSSAPTTLGNLSGHPSPFFHAENSPAAVHSPWGVANSPGMPRRSPMRIGQSPQPGQFEGGRASIQNRVLPQRSWAAAIPTILTHDALDILCTPTASTNPGGDPVLSPTASSQIHPSSPEKTTGLTNISRLERFLGCSYLRRALQRIVQGEEHLNQLPTSEPGVLLFRSETMHFRVGLDMSHFQSLHLKITSIPDCPVQWSMEECHLLESFFTSKVVRPPFRPNALAAFTKMISLPARIIRDCIQIIRLQLIPSIVEQHGWNWHVQLCLTVPPSALPIIPIGMPAVVISQSKCLIYLLLTRVQNSAMQMETESPDMAEQHRQFESERVPFIIAPLIHEMQNNVTTLAEKRNGPIQPESAALSQHLKRFVEFTQPSMDCSLFHAVQDILTNFAVSPDGQPMSVPPPQGPMVRPPMQQMMSPAQQQFAASQSPMVSMGPML